MDTTQTFEKIKQVYCSHFSEKISFALIKIIYNILTLFQNFITMFSIFKRKSNKLEVPEWASFFDNKGYTAFIKTIEDYFYKKNITYTLVDDGMASVGANDFGFGTLGLINVAQNCSQDEIANYEEIVSEHFESLIRANQFDKEFKKIIHDYHQVEKYIGVRLYSTEYLSSVDNNVTLTREVTGDVHATLIFDLPDCVISISTEEADKWGKTLEELFETGIQNIKSKCPFDISKEKLGEFQIWFVQGEHFFVPNIIFDLDNHLQLIGSKGSLIGIPHRHAVIVYPIESIAVANVITSLIPIIYGMNQEGPGSVSNNLIFYKDGKFENQPYKIADNKIEFYPTENFLEILNSLEE